MTKAEVEGKNEGSPLLAPDLLECKVSVVIQ